MDVLVSDELEAGFFGGSTSPVRLCCGSVEAAARTGVSAPSPKGLGVRLLPRLVSLLRAWFVPLCRTGREYRAGREVYRTAGVKFGIRLLLRVVPWCLLSTDRPLFRGLLAVDWRRVTGRSTESPGGGKWTDESFQRRFPKTSGGIVADSASAFADSSLRVTGRWLPSSGDETLGPGQSKSFNISWSSGFIGTGVAALRRRS